MLFSNPRWAHAVRYSEASSSHAATAMLNAMLHRVCGPLRVDHLIFVGGGVEEFFCATFFLSLPVFLFTAKAVQEIFFSNLPPPAPSRVKWSTL